MPHVQTWMQANKGGHTHTVISPATHPTVHPFIPGFAGTHIVAKTICVKLEGETTSSLIESVDLLGLWVAVQTIGAGPLQPGSYVASQHTHRNKNTGKRGCICLNTDF